MSTSHVQESNPRCPARTGVTGKKNPNHSWLGFRVLVVEHGTEPASTLNPKSVRKLVVSGLEQAAGFANIFRTEMAAIFARFDAADW
jgi:hypothetical protein